MEGGFENTDAERKSLPVAEEMRLAATLDQITFGFLVCDGEWRIVFINASAGRILGMDRDGIVGKSFRELLPGDLGTRVEREYRGASAGETRAFQFFSQPQLRWYQIHCFPRKEGGMSACLQDITGRKQMENTLVESEERYRLLYEYSADAIFILDMEGKFISVNEQACRMYGYTREEFRNMSVADIDAPEYGRQISERMAAIAQDGWSEFEATHRDARGRQLYVDVKVAKIPFGGRPCMVGINRDITERKLLEKELEQYFILFNTSSDLMCLFDSRAGYFLKVNPAFIRTLGYSEQELLTRPLTEFVHPDDLQRTHDEIAEQLEHGYTIDFENRYLRKDGSVCRLSWRVTADKVTGIAYATARDITRSKQYETEIRRYQDIVQSSDDAIIGKTLEGIVTSWNPGAEKIFGYDAVEMIGKPMTVLFPPEQIGEEQAFLAQIARGGTVNHYVSRRIRKDGSLIDVSVTLSPIIDDEGRIAGASKIARDITELMEHEHDLEEARAAADAANRAKSVFLSNMSHEIRTPMNGILGMTQLLEDSELDTEQKEYLDVIKTSSESLLSLINDVLDLSKIESGRIELELKDFSLRASINEVIKTQISLIRSKKLTIDTDIPAAVPDDLIGDQLRLKQALLNLVSNAVKFTEKGGIRISVSVAERNNDIALLKIGVADTGIGISPAVIRKIFEPFVQADASITRKHGGTGLGLSICTRLVELMGGKVWAESSVGTGSTFYLHIPFLVNKAVSEHRDRGRSGKLSAMWEGPSIRILLVDDQKTNLLIAGRLLQKAGHSVTEARDGVEAFQKWEQGAFDLILMDIQMPGMNGIEVARSIRERERESGNHIPIIALTARALREERDEILCHGFDGYVAKPLELAVLFSEMKRCLPQRASDGHEATNRFFPSPEVTGHTIDRTQITALLREIESLLTNNNMRVVDTVNELKKVLPAMVAVDTLRHHVKMCRFEEALTCIAEIRGGLGIER